MRHFILPLITSLIIVGCDSKRTTVSDPTPPSRINSTPASLKSNANVHFEESQFKTTRTVEKKPILNEVDDPRLDEVYPIEPTIQAEEAEHDTYKNYNDLQISDDVDDYPLKD